MELEHIININMIAAIHLSFWLKPLIYKFSPKIIEIY